MPMSQDFAARLEPLLPRLVEFYGTPFHIYDEQGIRETGERLKRAFAGGLGFREFFAVKALPNPAILFIMRSLGFGFDCSSVPELRLARKVGAGPSDIMFTSNNTALFEYQEALAAGGCILNLDDITFVPKVPEPFPELVCFRYNPGPLRTGTAVIGTPVEAKYGVRHDQLVDAYRLAKERGAKRFGIHTMVISNERDYTYMVETVRGLILLIEMISKELGITFKFLNMGGGIGIPYKPDDKPFDIEALGREAAVLLAAFKAKHGYQPHLFMESGRWMTGPHGVLVTKVINRMSKYREYVGVDACMSSLMRPGMYRDSGGGYHHITVFGKEDGPTEVVDVSGSLCENNDKFAVDRELPVVTEGDILLIHDTGAHGQAMGFNYNGRLRPQELLLRHDGRVILIRRPEAVYDLFLTLEFDSSLLTP